MRNRNLCFVLMQYDNTGWAPKEYNPDQDVSSGYTSGANHRGKPVTAGKEGERGHRKGPPHAAEFGGQGNTDAPGSEANKSGTSEQAEAPQSGFVWDEASGYYYDAASGFYYDGHRGKLWLVKYVRPFEIVSKL